MQNRVIRLVPRSLFNFTNVQGSMSVSIPLVSRIDISQYTSVVLSVTVFDRVVGAANASASFVLVADASTDWAFVVSSTALATVTIDENTSNGTVLIDALDPASLPAMLTLFVQGTQSTNATSIQVEVEVDLVLRQQ
ncbi:MAG: hypothetical protein M5U28_41945 [Sandaracinaceae bacterium]|nr:hypothetical protein [Sandaracinaceae bacterium]